MVFKNTEKERNKKTVGEGKAVAYQFLTFRKADDKLVGMMQVRLDLNDYLLNFGDYIGDSVDFAERNKGYEQGKLLWV